jgi:hypothetical protein
LAQIIFQMFSWQNGRSSLQHNRQYTSPALPQHLIKGVKILHNKLTSPEETKAWPPFITIFIMDLIEKQWY